MEKGVNRYWTQEQEELYKRLLDGCRTFAERHVIMSIRDVLKYDGRTKAAKRAAAQGRLRLMTATDEDLEEMAKLEVEIKGGGSPDSIPHKIQDYKRLRGEIKEKGIKRSELACR